MIEFRDAGIGDERFVLDAWVRSFRMSHYAGMIPVEDYHRLQTRWVQRLLNRDGVSVTIACNAEDTDQIFGFLCSEVGFSLPVVHYVYVKDDFRRLASKISRCRYGVATQLMHHKGIEPRRSYYYTFRTAHWASLSRHGAAFGGGIHRPMFARFRRDEAIAHETKMLAKRAKKTQTPKVEYKKCTTSKPSGSLTPSK